MKLKTGIWGLHDIITLLFDERFRSSSQRIRISREKWKIIGTHTSPITAEVGKLYQNLCISKDIHSA